MKKLLFSVLFCGALLTSCSDSKPQLYSLQGQVFGTTYGISYFSENPSLGLEAALDSTFLAINRSVSTYLPNSDISKINSGDSTVVIDDIFKDNFLLSAQIFKETGGYFDPTIGVLRNAYGFGDTAPIEQLDVATLDSLRVLVGFQKVSLTADNTIKKEYPGIYFDFNAVAKGYAIDRISVVFNGLQIDNYLIELGGEIRAGGKNLEKGKPWVVGIEAVDSELSNRSLAAKVSLNNKAMASSGNYRKYRIDAVTGQKYVHTINPLTGSAEKSDLTSATVFAPTCAEADAYATSFMAMGITRSLRLLPALKNVQVYLTYVDSSGNSRVFISETLKADLIKD